MRVRAKGESTDSLHFNTFSQIKIIVTTGNLWLSNIAATLFHRMLLKLCSLGPSKKVKEQSPGWVPHQTVYTPHVSTSALSPHACATFSKSWTSPMQCVTVCVLECSTPWQCGQSGPFKSPWAAGKSPKNDSAGQNETDRNNKSTQTDVHLRTNISIYIDHF